MTTARNPLKFRSALAANQNRKEMQYWQNLLADAPERVEYYYCKTIEALRRTPNKAILNRKLPKKTAQALQRITGGNPHAQHMVVMAIQALQLHKTTGANDIIIAMPIYKQEEIPGEKPVDLTYYVNTKLPIRIRIQPEKTFKELLLKVRQTIQEAVEHQNYPIEHLIEKMDRLQARRSTEQNGNPLYEIAVLQENIQDVAYLQGDNVNIIYSIKQTGTEHDPEQELTIRYNAAKYCRETITQLIAHNRRLMEILLENPDTTISAVNMQTEDERLQLEKFTRGPSVDIGTGTIHHMFEQQARQTPDQIAITGYTIWATHRAANITYRELNERANRLAHRLQARGVGPGTMVGLKTGRNIEMVVGMLGILKAGGAYLPLDLNYPPERIRYMIKDSNAREVLTEKEILEASDRTLPAPPIKLSIEPFPHNDLPSQLCYVIYTSGTTGKPKGVMLEHRNLVNLLAFQHRNTAIDHRRVLQYAGISFDVSFQEIFSTLLAGGTLYIADEKQRRDVPRLFRQVERNLIKTLFLPASFAKYVLNTAEHTEMFPSTVKHIVTAGEQIVVGEEFKKLLKRNRITLHNHYGPSETHVVTTMTQEPDDEIPDMPSIGRPIANVRTEILDRNGNRQPIGVAGQLYVGGLSVGRGYQNRPELTAERYIRPQDAQKPERFFSSELSVYVEARLYKTGDLALWRTDGTIEFLGRMDHQVKIRGYRIEPGEIETLIMSLSGVKEAVVIDRESENGEKYLCAYIVAEKENQGLPVSRLKKYLSDQLPEYMVPAAVVYLERIPLTPNRKVDRNALPAPETTADDNYVPPRNRHEEQQVQTWAEILDIEPRHIGIDDNFFALGGHSLKATGLINRLSKEYGVEITLAEMFQNPTVRQLTTLIEQKECTGHSPIEPAEEREYYLQSPAQKRLFILQQLDKNNTSYNMPTVIQLKGTLDRGKIERVFKDLIKRHESFRTTFSVIREQAVQRVHSEVPFRISYLDPTNREEQIKETVNRFVRPFDLSEAPLLRVGVIEKDRRHHVLIFDMHHIISDGTTQGIFNREFMHLYNGEQLSPLKLQYKDYSQWLRSETKNRELKKQEKYWLERFKGELPVLTLPTDYPRPAMQKFDGDRIGFLLDKETVAALGRIGEQEGASRFMVLQAVTTVWLWKLSGREDIVIGTPVAVRRHADLDSIIGMLINALVFRNHPGGEKTFRQFLKEVKTNTVEAFDNQEYPFEELVENVNVHRDTGRNPLFDVMFALQNMERPNVKVPQLELTTYPYKNKTAKFDLNLEAYENGDIMYFVLEYCTALFKKTTIHRFIDNYLNIIAQVTAIAAGIGPDTPMKQIDILGPLEKQQLLEMANGPQELEETAETIHQWFRNQVEKTPESIAVAGPNSIESSLTYRQLDRKAAALAHYLEVKGIGSDSIVAIQMESCQEMIIAIHGVLKAGACYMPLDMDTPAERIEYMLNDSNAKLLIKKSESPNNSAPNDHDNTNTDRHTKLTPEVLTIAHLDLEKSPVGEEYKAEVSTNLLSTNLCYVVYTSGSTGRPKGVMLEHGNLVNLLRYQYRYTTIRYGRVLQFAGIGFDVSFQEIFSTHLAGGTLVLLEKRVKQDVPMLLSKIREYGIETLYLPASYLNFILDREEYVAAIPDTVEHIVTAGEQLRVTAKFKEYLRKRRVTLHNHYGPTETHVVTTHTMAPGDEIPVLPPIGRPIANTTIHIIDKYGNLQPRGVAGQLLVGGANVGRGYQNQPELTAERFIEPQRAQNSRKIENFLSSEFSVLKAAKLYKTGDLARWKADGTLEFLGRIDHQVKIRGYRIELGEIENRLQAQPEIKEAVVIAREDQNGQQYLCAYVVPVENNNEEIHTKELRKRLAQHLPEYMLPARTMVLDAIPLNRNNKVDRKAFPEPAEAEPEAVEPPRNEIETQLVEHWARILDMEPRHIGIDNSFFELGGHSLKATILIARLNKEMNVHLTLAGMFANPTIRAQSKQIQAKQTQTDEKSVHSAPIEPGEQRQYYPQTSMQRRIFILQKMDKDNKSYNMPAVALMEGKFDRDKFETVLNQLVRRHESLRTSFREVNGEPVQQIHENVEFEIKYTDIKKDDSGPGKIIAAFIRPFDLNRAPLMRVGVIRLAEQEHILMFDMHHIINDGTSHGIFTREFMKLYGGESLPPMKIQYRDYAQKILRDIRSGAMKKQEAYWLKRFHGKLPVLALPTDYSRPPVQRFEGKRIGVSPPARMSDALGQTAREEGVTLFMITLTAVNILLWKLTGQEDIIVGTPIAGRRHADLESIIGMFTNTQVHRQYPTGEKRFREFLKEVGESTLEAFENQEYPFEELVEHLKIPRDASRNPLFDVMFAVQNMEWPEFKIPGITLRGYPYENQSAKFDLNMDFWEMKGAMRIDLEYSTALFKENTIRRYLDYYLKILEQITAAGGMEMKLSEFEIISSEEKKRLEKWATGPKLTDAEQITVHEWFEREARKTPESVALAGPTGSGIQVTYHRLNEKSNRLAQHLRERGVCRDNIVAIRIDTGVDMVIAILGILKAGGAYLPLDPQYPQERIQYMIKDSNVKVILESGTPDSGLGTNMDRTPEVLNIEDIDLENASEIDNPVPGTSPSQLCYVIYTSGSMGKPKGVMLEHRNLVNLLKNQYRDTEIDHSTVLQFTSISFDVSFQEIFSTLLVGGTLVLLDKEKKMDIPALYREIREQGIRTLYLPTSYLKFILGGEAARMEIPETVAHIVTAGEQLTVSPQFRRYLGERKITLHNHYGPSETHVVTTHTMKPGDEIPELPPIGRPIAGTALHIVDRYGNFQPQGVAGQLLIAGQNVGRGYQNQPELTAEKFGRKFGRSNHADIEELTTERLTGDVYYRTGDLARWNDDGTIQFLGRIDRQVKIRGYRIELGEIENRLMAMPEVKDIVVTARTGENGETYLCAYIVPAPQDNEPGTENQEGNIDNYRRRLAQQLPEHMQPARYVHMDSIPLTPSKKIDRNALPEPPRTRPRQGTEYQSPVTPMEKRIARIWKEKLNQDRVGIHDNFFDQGGNSLKLIAVAAELNRQLKRNIPVMDLFRYPTIQALARELELRMDSIPGTVDEEQKERQKERLKERLKEKQEEKKEKLNKKMNRLKTTRKKTRKNE
jgi:amino acid adenylation domain-containing protein